MTNAKRTHPTEWVDYRPTQWESQIDRLRNLCDGLVLAELEVLNLFVQDRLRVVRCEPDQVIETAGLSDPARVEAERMNAEGLHRFRFGYVGSEGYAAIATPADVAMRDTRFQRLLGSILDAATNPPVKGKP